MKFTAQLVSDVRAVVDAPDRAEGTVRVPPLPETSVSRTALVNHLRTHDAQVVLVTAPAGYGKTTLLAQWTRRDPRRFAWVRVHGAGDDPDELALRIATAVGWDPVDQPTIGDDEPERAARTFVRGLGRRLVTIDEPIVLVLDDVEELREPGSIALVATLADNLPPRTQLVLAGRRAPALPFARLRAEGVLLELHAGDLRMTERETAAVLQRMGVDLEADDIRDLHDRSEGWPVGLHVCALALQPGRGRAGRLGATFSGAHHFVSEYLNEEVLGALSEDLVTFATGCSVLDRMSGPLCDSVLGGHGSADRLHELAEAQTFVFPLDREHTWFRFHRFFRDALLTRLTQGEPERFIELSARAADWYEAEGDVVKAIRHVRAIGDRARAADLLGALTPEVVTHGLTSIEDDLDELRDERLLARHPSAAVTGALVHAMLGHTTEAAHWAAAAERADPRGPMPDGSPSAHAWVALVRAALCHDGAEQMRVDAGRALRNLAPHSPLVPFALLMLGVAHALSGDRRSAEARLTEAAELAGPNAPLVATVALAELSLMAQADENWSRGEALARSARDHALELDEGTHVFAGPALTASARSALRNSNWVRAGDDIDRLQVVLPRTNETLSWLSARMRLELARAHLALNDLAAADELVTEVERLLLVRPHLERADTEARELRVKINASRNVPREVSMLTSAELRLLPLLTTHLTFRQIAQHLYVSRNTIKTQAISVYRKLGVSSRTEAIDRAVELGLLRPEGELVVERPD